VYVEVYAYSDTTFSLRAQAPEPVALEGAVELSLGTQVFGSVDTNQRQVYQINNAAVVDLESISGDADLFIFSDSGLAFESMVCSSVFYSRQSTLDSCSVPAAQNTYYVVVFGFSSSNYSIVARAAESIDPIRLIPGQNLVNWRCRSHCDR